MFDKTYSLVWTNAQAKSAKSKGKGMECVGRKCYISAESGFGAAAAAEKHLKDAKISHTLTL